MIVEKKSTNFFQYCSIPCIVSEILVICVCRHEFAILNEE